MKFLKFFYLALVKSQSEQDGYKGNFRGLDIYKYIQRSNAVYEIQNAVSFDEFQRAKKPGLGFGNINKGSSVSAFGIEVATANRVNQIMKMTMFLQETPSFDKFYRYGCWCFVKGVESVLGGHGEPVDEIDRVCQRFHKCISCVNLDHVDCPDWAPYTFKTNKSRASGEKNIVCKNKRGTCRRHHCECDRKMAMDLVALESQHSPYFSHANGAFDTEKFCAAKTKNDKSTSKAKTEQAKMEFSSGVSRNEESCCGEYPERFPFRLFQGGNLRKCCGNRTYDPRRLACCRGDELKPLGTCT